MPLLLLISIMMTTITVFSVYGAEETTGPLAMISMENEHLWGKHMSFSPMLL
jgi:phenylacetate-coenzyme A ligase PaaK-like adenylate-forming protein